MICWFFLLASAVRRNLVRRAYRVSVQRRVALQQQLASLRIELLHAHIAESTSHLRLNALGRTTHH